MCCNVYIHKCMTADHGSDPWECVCRSCYRASGWWFAHACVGCWAWQCNGRPQGPCGRDAPGRVSGQSLKYVPTAAAVCDPSIDMK